MKPGQKKPKRGQPAPAGRPQNARANQQTRRVLGQHYRAKYGVK
jgi:hypothetical protein